ncbi:hypothetical protein [Asanoa ishikariensis]|uniref:class III lanthionine synthetase LanKC N-terminal domain-containing protein n=1 Tax=Asanoa ishikariensis TaxID=137265 RepID=UPI00115F880A|nr:hypothetical protein [Asanoa ishikariensis]
MTESDSLLLLDIARAVLGRSSGTRWSVRPTDAWCHVTSPAGVSRKHGWKLHLRATPLSAPLVLARATEVPIERECSFKFATAIRRVIELVDGWYDRGGSGKFVTGYPTDDEHFRVVAEELHRATDEMAGPRILSDRQLRPGSLVHYRYGEFLSERAFTDDGLFE